MPQHDVASKRAVPEPDPRFPSPLGALLSFLVPGLGQLYQGRIGKGLLFMVALYGMFFAGMYLGDWKNVYIPDTSNGRPGRFQFASDLWIRPQYVGQFWIGFIAWPAIWQYNGMPVPSAEKSPFLHYFEYPPPEKPEEIGHKPYENWQGKSLWELQRDGDKTWDLGWVYTVIAGALNVLVIYDALAGPAVRKVASSPEPRRAEVAPA